MRWFAACPAGERTKLADSLKYRDFLTVMLILKDRQMFDDTDLYVRA